MNSATFGIRNLKFCLKIEACIPKQDLQGKSVAVIGLGKSGIAVTNLALARGASVLALDQNETLRPLELDALNAEYGHLTAPGRVDHELLDVADVIVVSPGVPLENYGLVSLIQSGKRVMSELDFAAEVLPRYTKILAVTGTNGKSSVATFAGQILSHSNIRTFVGGNLGVPLSEAALCCLSSPERPFQVAVVEVSSYQLEIPNKHFCPSVSVILNLTPDHLERHKSMTNYAMIKCHVFSHMSGQKIAILPLGNPYLTDAITLLANECNFAWIGAHPGVKVDMETKVAHFNVPTIGLSSNLPLGSLKAIGTHNYYNAAIAALSVIGLDVGIDASDITSTINKLKPPPHRMQFNARGVTWVDDSKATNVEATYAGLMGFTEKKSVVLLGGLSKVSHIQDSNGFEQLVEPLKNHQGVVTFGSSGMLIQDTLLAHGLNIPCLRATDLKSAVMLAKSMAKPALKAAIVKDPNQALISWSESDSTPCRWGGITCDRAYRRVVAISLSNKNLTGYIPSEIGALSFLTSLDLSQNYFSGPFPQHIAALQNLVHLDISSNNFNGSLPESLGNLTHLIGTLNLSYNAFSGEIPASFGQFPVMVSLDLQHNNLTGKVPQVGSLLNQGPTAFSGNPYLCGFPLNSPCTKPEAQNPRFLENPQKPENPGELVRSRKINGGSVTVSVISGVSVVVGVVFVSVWVIRKKWKVEEKDRLGKENGSREVVVMGNEEGQKGKFIVLDEGFGLELEDLLRASAYVLGKSGSGIVYRVVVGGGGKGVGPVARPPPVVAAVRRLSEGDTSWKYKDFEAEVEAIGKVQHPNIVRLRAYYYASDEKLLISDFIKNGSLYNALHGGPGDTLPPLSWASRLRIIQGSARGLMHIHECCPRKYIHGNIKSSKILLDDDLTPYISGFGLSRLVPAGISNAPSRKPNQHQNIVGVKGSVSSSIIMNIAPEARLVGTRLTQKCDVYSFGILLMEILTGWVPQDDGKEGLESVVRKVFREERPLSEIIDPALLHEARAKKQVVATFHVALNCTERDPELRPKMRTVSDNLDRINLQ